MAMHEQKNLVIEFKISIPLSNLLTHQVKYLGTLAPVMITSKFPLIRNQRKEISG